MVFKDLVEIPYPPLSLIGFRALSSGFMVYTSGTGTSFRIYGFRAQSFSLNQKAPSLNPKSETLNRSPKLTLSKFCRWHMGGASPRRLKTTWSAPAQSLLSPVAALLGNP